MPFSAVAIASFERYVQLRPDTCDSYQFLSQSYVQKKDTARAVSCATKALSLDPESINATYAMAQAYELSGQKKEALQQYQRLSAMEISSEYRKSLEKKIKELQ